MARLLAEALEAAPQEVEGFLGAAQGTRGLEIGAGQVLVLVLQADGNAVELESVVETALVPVDPGQHVVVDRVDGIGAWPAAAGTWHADARGHRR